ncbi:MAG: 50S ribosomal protein L10 [Armatimonadetes bacterium 13_1_40CM_3_65_7]|nr:MAG: 50S ribosomal protein L10 [Armatimonadetes bacterium 13_1_40CM_3_65_7]
MANPKPEKVAVVEDLERRLRASAVVILTDYRGLSVTEIGTLRGRLREAHVEYRVAKNTLLALAAKRCGAAGLERFLTGPTAVAFGLDDPGVPARVLQEFIRQYRKLEIKGGLVAGETVDADGVRLLATLPSRGELLAKAAGAIQAPLRGLVTALSAPARMLVVALDALRAQREKSGAGAGLGAGAAEGAAAPEAAAPEATAPEATAPEAAAPEATAPEATAPEAAAPQVAEPEESGH